MCITWCRLLFHINHIIKNLFRYIENMNAYRRSILCKNQFPSLDCICTNNLHEKWNFFQVNVNDFSGIFLQNNCDVKMLTCRQNIFSNFFFVYKTDHRHKYDKFHAVFKFHINWVLQLFLHNWIIIRWRQ